MKLPRTYSSQPAVCPRWKLGCTVVGQVVLAAFSLSTVIAADGPIASVQETLRRERLMTAEPSGVLDETTRNALRRFQTQRSLPATGEIDSATLQALQSSTETASPPVIQPIPATPAPQPSSAIMAKDRAFLEGLKEVETSQVAPAPAFRVAREESLPPAPAPKPAAAVTNIETAPPIEAPVTSRQGATSLRPPKPQPANPEAGNSASRGLKESPAVAPRKIGKTSRERIVFTPEQRPAKPVASANRPPRRIEEHDIDRESLEPQGVRIIRHPTKMEQPEDRITITERRTKTYVGQVVEPVEVRRATPVEPPKKEGFFQRLFKDDENDRDKDDD